MTISRTQLILLGVAALFVAITFFVAGRNCSETVVVTTPEVVGVDAGPGDEEIAERLDASLRMSEERIGEIEDKFEEDIAAFDEAQRAEYDRLRHGDDLEAAAVYLSDWNRRRRGESR